jgi:hypothetical protein
MADVPHGSIEAERAEAVTALREIADRLEALPPGAADERVADVAHLLTELRRRVARTGRSDVAPPLRIQAPGQQPAIASAPPRTVWRRVTAELARMDLLDAREARLRSGQSHGVTRGPSRRHRRTDRHPTTRR